MKTHDRQRWLPRRAAPWIERLGVLGLGVGLALVPVSASAIQNPEPSDDFFQTVEELDATARAPGLEQTPVLHLVFSDGRLHFERSPWQLVANPYNTDPGEASYRNEPNYEPGVVILNF